MKYFKKIEGERIYLSPLNIEDAETYLKWLCDRSVTEGTHGVHKVLNIEAEKAWITSELEKGNYTFGIILKAKDKLIGNCSIMGTNYIDGTAELGIFIGEEEHRNNSYGAEALNLLLDYGFNILRLHNINLHVYSFNKRAIECYKKIGFKEYGRRHECYYLNGKYHDKIAMEILKDDYKKNN